MAASSNPVLKKAWRPCVELKQLVSEVKHKRMVKGAQSNSCKLGIGAGLCRVKTRDTEAAQERAEALSTFEETQEDRRLNGCIKKEHFSEWVKWGETMQQDRDWNKVIKSQEDDLFRFNLAATEDVLPTPKCAQMLETTLESKVQLVPRKECVTTSHSLWVPSGSSSRQTNLATRLSATSYLPNNTGNAQPRESPIPVR